MATTSPSGYLLLTFNLGNIGALTTATITRQLFIAKRNYTIWSVTAASGTALTDHAGATAADLTLTTNTPKTLTTAYRTSNVDTANRPIVMPVQRLSIDDGEVVLFKIIPQTDLTGKAQFNDLIVQLEVS